jgi:hypothetical protein
MVILDLFVPDSNGNGLGSALLVSQLQFQLSSIGSEMQPKEVSLQIKNSELAYNLLAEQRSRLASILTAFEEVFLSQRDKSEIFEIFIWWVNGQLFQTYHTNIGEHGYVTPTDYVMDMLGHRISIELRAKTIANVCPKYQFDKQHTMPIHSRTE